MVIPNEFDEICYRRNFLTEVIVRIDFVSPVKNIANDLPKNLSKSILKYFPIDEPKSAFMQEFIVAPTELHTRKQEFTEWNFFGRNREKRFVITQNFFFIGYQKYENYEGLRNEFLEIAGEFFKTFDQAQPSRLGLRYINEIKLNKGDPIEWSEYISSELLGLFSYSVEGAESNRIFHNIEFIIDDFSLRFQFGIHNPDYPAPIRQKIFVLDYDAYFKGPIETPDIPRLLDKYHKGIQNIFESNITGKLKGLMNE